MGFTPRYLPSGAGHDAMAMADLTDVGMLFVRCAGGVSHNPEEAMTLEDADIATRVLLTFLRRHLQQLKETG
jgi:acetylornithine deacetylase/succinyl-diaminopimelate desuccinylase-like protein